MRSREPLGRARKQGPSKRTQEAKLHPTSQTRTKKGIQWRPVVARQRGAPTRETKARFQGPAHGASHSRKENPRRKYPARARLQTATTPQLRHSVKLTKKGTKALP